jgi:restriction endonuclease S subunit
MYKEIKYKMRLGSAAMVRTGIFAKPVSAGEVVYLQPRHFTENGQIHSLVYPDLKLNSTIEKHLLRQDDILFAAKGDKNFAALYKNNVQPSVASTSFLVIRLQEKFNDNILPEFLVWLINQPVAQKFLKGKAIGTSIVSISKSVLEELELSIPDAKTQKAILKISELHKKEKKIMHRIEELKEKIIQQQILNAIK